MSKIKKKAGLHLYEIINKTTKKKHWHWNVISRNGRVLATSETYTTKQGATKGIESLVNHFKSYHHYYDHTAKGVVNLAVYQP